jgi:hypothetical protein
MMFLTGLCLWAAFYQAVRNDERLKQGLKPEEAEAGWLSLFDGTTDLGWAGAQVKDGLLGGGRCGQFGLAFRASKRNVRSRHLQPRSRIGCLRMQTYVAFRPRFQRGSLAAMCWALRATCCR